MTHQFSTEIHTYVSDKIKWAEALKAQAMTENDMPRQQFFEGQLAEWLKMRDYMAKSIDLETQQYF